VGLMVLPTAALSLLKKEGWESSADPRLMALRSAMLQLPAKVAAPGRALEQPCGRHCSCARPCRPEEQGTCCCWAAFRAGAPVCFAPFGMLALMGCISASVPLMPSDCGHAGSKKKVIEEVGGRAATGIPLNCVFICG